MEEVMSNEIANQILVVDDTNDPLDTLTNYLAQNDYQVCHAHSVADALHIINRDGILLVATAADLPGLDGFDLLQEVKLSRGTVQVIIIAGEPQIELLFRALDNGASDFLIRPLSEEQMKSAFQSARDKIIRWRETMQAAYESQEV